MAEEYRVELWNGSHPPDPSVLRQTLVKEGYSVFEWSERPGTKYGVHKHSEEQSHWIISGSLELQIEGRDTYVLNAGDRDFMPAGTNHAARVVGDEPVVYLIGEKIRRREIISDKTTAVRG